MRPGSSIALFAVALWSTPVWGEPSVNLPAPPGADAAHHVTRPARIAAEALAPTIATLKQEAYYHFFLDDYLTAATRLKLLEDSVRADADTLDQIQLLRGGLYLAWGMHRPAAVIFDRLASAFPPGQSRDQVLLLIERLQYSRGLYQAAISTYEKLHAGSAFSSMDQATYLAGMSEYALGNFERAIEVTAKIPAASTFHPFAQLTSAKSETQIANVDQASRILRELGALDAEGDPVLQALADKSRLTMGLLSTELGRYDEALPAFASVPETSPFYPDALFGEGWAHLYRQQYAQSLAAFLALLHAAPHHPYALEALTTVGHCYDRMGARGEAFQAYGTALATYRREQQSLNAMRTLINDRDRLGGLLSSVTVVLDSPLAPLLDDDGLRYWIKQYGELGALEQYLAARLHDSEVFQVMVDHRDAVFRDNLPAVNGFLANNPVTPLRDRQRGIEATLERASEGEAPDSWATGNEALLLSQLGLASRQSQTVWRSIEQFKTSHPSDQAQVADLRAQWLKTNRWLNLLQGEQLWTILTQVPGRRDDFERAIEHDETDLDNADRNLRALVEAIGLLDHEISQFRQRIASVRQDLIGYRGRVVDLRAQLLPPLQALLLKAVDQRSGQMEAMAAVAQLSQLHIMDVLTQ